MQAAINAAGGQLPKNLPSPPTFRKVNPADAPIMIIGVHSDVLPMTEVDDYADTMLAQQISQIPGVGQVNIGGEQKPAVRVQVDPAKLASLGLVARGRARRAGQRHRRTRPRAASTTVTRSFTIYDNDQLTQAPDYDDVIVAYRNGAPVRMRDIGHGDRRRRRTPSSPPGRTASRGVLLIVFKQPGANVIETVGQRSRRPCRSCEAAIPPAVKVQVMSDRTQTIRASVDDVEFTLLLTIALVVMVIFLFLRNLWATIIPSVTVPLALVGTCGRDVRGRLQPRQPVADGADHRGRLRRRRRDRHAREHLPPHRGGRAAAARRRSRARARSASPSSRSASRWSPSSSRCC